MTPPPEAERLRFAKEAVVRRMVDALRRRDGAVIGDLGSAHDEELLVRDMDLDKIQEVRQTWQFYRDRRPDAYADLVTP